MQKLKRIAQIIGRGLLAALCGGLVGGLSGSLSFGLIYLFYLWSFGREIIAMPFLQSNLWFIFYLGNNLGMTAGALGWLFPGLLRAAHRYTFPWRRMAQYTAIGAVTGTLITALNAFFILAYSAKTRLPSTPTDLRDFWGFGPLPQRIGPFISTELPFFMMIMGLFLGVLFGVWWGTRKPRPKEQVVLSNNEPAVLEPA